MDFEKNFEFYWQGESKQKRDIFTEKFNSELECEIEFFKSNNFTEILNVLNNFKSRKNQYENNSNNSTYLQYLNQAINSVSWIYSECKSITKYETIKRAIEQQIIITNNPLRKRLLPLNANERNVAIVDDMHIGFYYNFKLQEYIEPDSISNYKSELDNALLLTKKNNEKISEDHEYYNKKIDDEIIEYQATVERILSSYKDEMEDLEKQYEKKLQFDEPSKFWNTKAKDYKILSDEWYMKSILAVIILLVVTVIISMFIFDIEWDAHIITIKMVGFSNDLTFGNVLLIAVIESIIIYILKTCIKYYDYNLKLYEFYKSKEMLSSFYVTIKDDDLSDDIKEKIYTQLFASSSVDFDKVDDIGFNSKLKG